MSAFAFSSGEQIKWKKISSAKRNLPWSVLKKSQGKAKCSEDCSAASYHIGGKKYIREPYAKDLNLYSISPSTYQEAGLMSRNVLPTPECKTPFPFVLNHNSSQQVNYNTSQEAKSAGALPSNWPVCHDTDTCCPSSNSQTTTAI